MRPALVVCLGATAAQALLGREARVGKLRGSRLELEGGVPAIVTMHPSAVLRADDYEHAWNYVKRPDKRFTLDVLELIERLEALADEPSSWTTEEFPLVLSAGERRAFTANTIIRDPSWRKAEA